MCAGAGGQALGLEEAGFHHLACVEIDEDACQTLRLNRPCWDVLHADIRSEQVLAAASRPKEDGGWQGVDLLAGGVPCPPFSVAGKQLGHEDERDLFPAMIDLAAASRPRAVLIENVRGLLADRFADYRGRIEDAFEELGYEHMGWKLLNASDYGVPQLRPRVAMVALLPEVAAHFSWPRTTPGTTVTVGQALRDQMASRGWEGASAWADSASDIAPTLVGGSKKHGGPDLGPTRAKRAWEKLGVNGHTIAELAPGPDHDGPPRLTVAMAATLQGFPPEWTISGRKTTAYRQVGNAFPPPVARVLGVAIGAALRTADEEAEALKSAADLVDVPASQLLAEIVGLRQRARRREIESESLARMRKRDQKEKERLRLEVIELHAKVRNALSSAAANEASDSDSAD